MVHPNQLKCTKIPLPSHKVRDQYKDGLQLG